MQRDDAMGEATPSEYIHTVKEQAVFELVRMLGVSNEQLDGVAAEVQAWVMSNRAADDPSLRAKTDLAMEMQNWINSIKDLKQRFSAFHIDAKS